MAEPSAPVWKFVRLDHHSGKALIGPVCFTTICASVFDAASDLLNKGHLWASLWLFFSSQSFLRVYLSYRREPCVGVLNVSACGLKPRVWTGLCHDGRIAPAFFAA